MAKMIANRTEEMVKGPTFVNSLAIVFESPVVAPHTHASKRATIGDINFLLLYLFKNTLIGTNSCICSIQFHL